MTELYEAVVERYGQRPGRGYAEPYWQLLYVVDAVLVLHEPTSAPAPTMRKVETYDKDGQPLGVTVQVPGDPVPGWWCPQCECLAPCPTIEAIAEKLGIAA